MKISKNHHYLPEFYLKGFANQENKLYIYDKKRNTLKKGNYSPSSHFFIHNRNSIEINEDLDDFPEKMYSEIDNTDKYIIKYIQEKSNAFTLDSDQIFQLQIFILNFIWRNPEYDEDYKKAILDNDPQTNLFVIKKINNDTNAPKQFIEELKNSTAFIKSFRSVFGILKWMKAKSKYDHENWRISYNPKEYVLISDNPVIKFSESLDLFDSDFIFPLTKKFTLIRSSKSIQVKELPAAFTLLVDVIIMQQANYYVACSNEEHLQQIIMLSKWINPDFAKNELFQILKICTNS